MDFQVKAEIIEPRHNGCRILVWLEPSGKLYSIPRVKTCAQLLRFFDIPEEGALVVRAGKLLTHDKRIWPNDEVLVRTVISRG